MRGFDISSVILLCFVHDLRFIELCLSAAEFGGSCMQGFCICGVGLLLATMARFPGHTAFRDSAYTVYSL